MLLLGNLFIIALAENKNKDFDFLQNLFLITVNGNQLIQNYNVKVNNNNG